MAHKLAIAFLCAVILSVSPPPVAAAGNPESLVSGYISRQLHRLKLTPAQKPKLRRALAITSAKRRNIFSSVGVTLGRKASYMQLFSLKSKIGKIAPGARARVARVLTPKQLRVYDKIRNEVAQLLKRKLA